MADRLKQIWADFSSRTSVHLTAVDIEGLPRPERSDRTEGDVAEFTPKAAQGQLGESDAVQAAFQALHADIQAKAKNSRRRRAEPEASFSDTAPLPDMLDEQLLADLRSTDMRVRRGSSDYLSYAAERQEAWKRQKKKRFFGLF